MIRDRNIPASTPNVPNKPTITIKNCGTNHCLHQIVGHGQLADTLEVGKPMGMSQLKVKEGKGKNIAQ